MSTFWERGSRNGRWKGLSCGSLAGDIRAQTMVSEACSAVPAEKLSRSHLLVKRRGGRASCGGPVITGLAVCSSHIRGALLHCEPVSARSLPVRTSSNS